ncbi:C4-dicarboxylic acid transporter DauA [Poriferisphaera corsica]|uniref:C4-dicarboxylic acid transporter DauA n=1 Tax=Poriferisphaera corsica TaxID=2528020 RepID=A0A517YPJ9_9BACT|nr:SulP family inorganic anion transporter [Poriferisphaera corsica]QDU32146.1 C4-dicarboxylic acid transporter DauA [Poriferisphaera corsica]
MQQSIKPKLFTVIREYNREQFAKDVVAGVLVGIIAIPLSIALAIASGVGPEMGLYTAAVAGFLISFFGGSRVQIGGPTAAFVPVVYGVVQQYGVEGLAVAAIMAGGLLILMGVLRLGGMIKYIPYPVVTGFTAGIAVAIGVKQLRDLMGMEIDRLPGDFVGMCEVYWANMDGVDWGTILVGLLSLIVIVCWGRLPWGWVKYLPGSLIAIVMATVGVMLFKLEGVATIGSRFSGLEGGLPRLTVPSGVDWVMVKDLIGPAVTIAVLAGVESLLSAVVSDGMIGGHHRSNAELVGQGLANIGSAMFGGIPATGAIARTAANVRSGGRTPMAGLVHAGVVMLVVVVLMPYAKMIPLTTLAAVLLVVAYNMGDWVAFRDLGKGPKSDGVVFLLTFGLTVVFDLVVAIEIGLILAVFLFMKRMADVSEVKILDEGAGVCDELDDDAVRGDMLSKYQGELVLYEIKGPFFFGAADKFVDVTRKLGASTKGIILKMENVPAMDGTGLHHLETFVGVCERSGIRLYLVDVQKQPKRVLDKRGLMQRYSFIAFCADIREAVERYGRDRQGMAEALPDREVLLGN